jgi:hypothetical protein
MLEEGVFRWKSCSLLGATICWGAPPYSPARRVARTAAISQGRPHINKLLGHDPLAFPFDSRCRLLSGYEREIFVILLKPEPRSVHVLVRADCRQSLMMDDLICSQTIALRRHLQSAPRSSRVNRVKSRFTRLPPLPSFTST